MHAMIGNSTVLLLVVEWLGVALVLAKVGDPVLALEQWRFDQEGRLHAMFALWMAGLHQIKALALWHQSPVTYTAVVAARPWRTTSIIYVYKQKERRLILLVPSRPCCG